MKKRSCTTARWLGLLVYLFYLTVCLVFLAILFFDDPSSGTADSVGAAIGLAAAAVLLALLKIILIGVAVVLFIPSLLKIIQVSTGKDGLSFGCLPFDIVLILLFGALSVSALASNPGAAILPVIGLSSGILSLVLNIRCISCRK